MAGLAARLSQLRLRLRGSLPWLLLCLLAALAIRRWVWMPTLIQGQSMLPTLAEGEVGGINKLAYLRREPERGDLVGVWTGTELMAKRVVGLPGEQVAVHDGVLWVNGAPLAEPYVEFSDPWKQVREGKIESGCFLVAGDNRSASVMAVVGRARIVGRLATFGRLWRREPQDIQTPAAAWLTNSSALGRVDGLNVVTNPVRGAQGFYRLSQ